MASHPLCRIFVSRDCGFCGKLPFGWLDLYETEFSLLPPPPYARMMSQPKAPAKNCSLPLRVPRVRVAQPELQIMKSLSGHRQALLTLVIILTYLTYKDVVQMRSYCMGSPWHPSSPVTNMRGAEGTSLSWVLSIHTYMTYVFFREQVGLTQIVLSAALMKWSPPQNSSHSFHQSWEHYLGWPVHL